MVFTSLRRLLFGLSLSFACELYAEPLRCEGVVLDYARVLDAPRSNQAIGDDRWVPNAIEFIAATPWTAEVKVANLRGLFQEVRRRDHRKTLRWNFAEHQAGPTTVFVGGLGYFVEIRPDGSVYRGLLDPDAVENPQFMRPDWNPQGDANGLAEGYLEERWRVSGP